MRPREVTRSPATRDRAVDGWLSAADELVAYNGIRAGDEAGFRLVAEPLQPVLRRLAGLTTTSPVEAREVVVATWRGALRSIGMFWWSTSFATWLARATVERGRSRASRPGAEALPRPVRGFRRPAPGPVDWSDLPFSARWDGALEVLATTQASMPLELREVLHVSAVERWPRARSCQVLGLPADTFDRLLEDAQRQLVDALAWFIGDDASSAMHERMEHVAAALRMLTAPTADDAEPLDPDVVAVFRDWRAEHVPTWLRVRTRVFSRVKRHLRDKARREVADPRNSSI